MPQDHKCGTVWDLSLCDYAYTRAFSTAGWAWEFLRRNETYQHEYNLHKSTCPRPSAHISGAQVFDLNQRPITAEKWGLVFYCDPLKTALQSSPLWLPTLLKSVAFCEARKANVKDEEHLSLASFCGQRTVLVYEKHEVIVIERANKCACLIVTDGSFLTGNCALKFHHCGLKSAARHFETLKILTQLTKESAAAAVPISTFDSKYRDYLVALDGRLAGRSYRDIAEVLYGPDRVGSHWTDDTWGLKSKVRRAVECGLALMNGGYRDLL